MYLGRSTSMKIHLTYVFQTFQGRLLVGPGIRTRTRDQGQWRRHWDIKAQKRTICLCFVFYFCRALPRVCGCSPLWWSGTSSSWPPHRMGVRSGPVVSQYVWLVFVSPHLPYLPLAGRTIIHSHSANPQNPAIDEASLPCGIEPSNCEGGSLIAPVTELIFFLFRINTFYTSRICCKFCHFQFVINGGQSPIKWGENVRFYLVKIQKSFQNPNPMCPIVWHICR